MPWLVIVGAAVAWLVSLRVFREYDADRKARSIPLDPGNSRYLKRHEAQKAGWLGGAKKIRIGYWDKSCLSPLFYNGKAHLFLVAPARSGKARDVLIPALLEYEGSCVVIDPKGQLASVTGPQRARMGQEVFILNPFNMWPRYLGGMTHAGYNPLSALDPAADSFGADCDSLAEGIVYNEGDLNNFFVESARTLVSGCIAATVAYAVPESRNLARITQIISGKYFPDFARKMATCGDEVIETRLARFAVEDTEKGRDSLNDVIDTARTALRFATNTAIANSLRAHGPQLRFANLRKKPTTVYLILPPEQIQNTAKWFRLVTAAAVAELMRAVQTGNVSTLMVLDEFAQLGNLTVMSHLMGLGAGLGIQLWPVLQNMKQLQTLYPDWSTFLSGAGVQLYFAPRQADPDTSQHISQASGMTEVVTPTGGVNVNLWNPRSQEGQLGGTRGYSKITRPLIYPHDAVAVGNDEMLVIGDDFGNRVIRAGRKPYFKIPECAGKYSPDPYEAKR